MPVVDAVLGIASVPKSHSYRTIVEVAPEAVAVKITVSPTLGLLFEAVMMTEGG